MEKNEILAEINKIFIDVLDDPAVVLHPQTTAHDVPGWDSLSYIHLVVAVEKRFSIRFTASEIQSWGTVGDMVDSVENRINNQGKR